MHTRRVFGICRALTKRVKKGTMRMSGSLKSGTGNPVPAAMRHSTHTKRKEVRNMKKLFAVIFLALFATVPSFGAEHVVTRSAKTAGKESVQAVKYSAAKVDHAAKATMRFLF
jgi:hypothetical protein